MAEYITQAQYKEIEAAESAGDDEKFNSLLQKYAGITARPYTAYNYYDADGDYCGDSNDSLLDELLRAAYVEVGNVAEYINKKSLLERIKDLGTWPECKYGGFTLKEHPFGMFDCDDVINTIEGAPAADVVPVVHGEWKELTNCSNAGVYCSVCHKRVYAGDYARCNKRNKIRSNFCPNCGAEMQGSKNRRMGQNVILGSCINVDMMDREDAKNELARQAGMCVEQYIRDNDALIERDGTIGWKVTIYKEG